MAKVYDKTDLFWTGRGDYLVGGEGDVMDTLADPLRSLVQEVRTRVKADQGDWKSFENLGATISEFVGEANSPLTAEAIKTRIISALARDGFIHTRDMKIKYLPADRDKLFIRTSFKVAPTARNAQSEEIVQSFLYSFSENNVYFVNRR